MGMSGMASEMQRRMNEDGGAGLANEDRVPGSGTVDPATPQPAAPPAGESNTDTAAGTSVPDTIPYARFKEVNDQLASLKDYQMLREYGYDPDSLGRLAAFEAQYQQDPIGTIHSMVSNLDLPQDLKDTFEAKLREHKLLDAPSGSAQGEPPVDGAKAAELPPEVQERLKYVDQLREREEQAKNDAVLDQVLAAWKDMDTKDGMKSPSEVAMLRNIAQTLQNGRYASVEEVASAAREPFVEYRSAILGDALQGTGRGGTPPVTLPGSLPSPAGPVKFTNIKDATKAAAAAIQRGELPPLTGE